MAEPPASDVFTSRRDDSTRNHAYEVGRLSNSAWKVIRERAAFVWLDLQEPGRGGGTQCAETVAQWKSEFQTANVPVQYCAGGGSPKYGCKTGGYRLANGDLSSDHFWLAVGDNLALFDPTWRQFEGEGEPALDRYWLRDDVSFAKWREGELQQRDHRGLDQATACDPPDWRTRVFSRRRPW